jgi:hypothetical protein
VCYQPSALDPSCTSSNLGAACGSWPQIGYTCKSVHSQGVCLPPNTSGVGTLTNAPNTGDSPPQQYSGCAGVANQGWINAAITAGGGRTPYYKIFKRACPYAYSFGFDDHAGDFQCNDSDSLSFDVTFCGIASNDTAPTAPAAPVSAKGSNLGTHRGKP